MARIRKNVSFTESPDKSQSQDWDFPVFQEELKTSRNVNSGIHAVIRADTGTVIGQYRGEKVLPYGQLVETFETALSNNGLTVTSRKMTTTGDGARFFGQYKVGDVRVGNESFARILTLQSSHNGTLTPGFCGEAERLACLNGMILSEMVYSIFKRHSTNFDLGFVGENIVQALESIDKGTNLLVESMVEKPVSQGLARNILSNIVAKSKGVISPKIAYLVNYNWETPSADEKPLGDNLYRLYNAATRFTRDLTNVDRLELSRRANTYLTGAFNLAATRPHDWQALTATPSQMLDFDGITIQNN